MLATFVSWFCLKLQTHKIDSYAARFELLIPHSALHRCWLACKSYMGSTDLHRPDRNCLRSPRGRPTLRNPEATSTHTLCSGRAPNVPAYCRSPNGGATAAYGTAHCRAPAASHHHGSAPSADSSAADSRAPSGHPSLWSGGTKPPAHGFRGSQSGLSSTKAKVEPRSRS